MKICTVIGARPQFIKAAALSRILRNKHEEILIHTGQHYDYNMSDIFFEELSIPQPDYNLGVSGGTHGEMTGKMLIETEKVLIAEKPDMVIVYGDTNSTLAGALAAAKLRIPVAHMEAGVRFHTLDNPEEVNRVLTDRISRLLFCFTASGQEELRAEGRTDGVYMAGDLMYDAVLYYGANMGDPGSVTLTSLVGENLPVPNIYYYLTCHRQENTQTDENLLEILKAMEETGDKTVYPVHPRNQERVLRLQSSHGFSNILFVKPVGYLDSISLCAHAQKIVTDSGGLQREAWFLGKQCVTVFPVVVWPETMEGNINQMAAAKKEDILAKLNVEPDFTKKGNQFGDGRAAERICEILETAG